MISYWTSADFGQPSPGVAIEANVGGAIFTVFAGNCNVQVLQGFEVPDPDGFTEIFNNANPTQACLSEFPAGANVVNRFPLYTIAGVDYGNFAVDYELTEGNTTTLFRQQYETRYNGVNFFIFCGDPAVRDVTVTEAPVVEPPRTQKPVSTSIVPTGQKLLVSALINSCQPDN